MLRMRSCVTFLLLISQPRDKKCQNPQLIEHRKPRGQFHNFEATRSSDACSSSFHASEPTYTRPSRTSQSGHYPMHDALETQEAREQGENVYTPRPAPRHGPDVASNSQQNPQQVILDYALGRTRREGSLSLNDFTGEAFLSQLSKYYASAHRTSPRLDRSAYHVQFTAVTEDAQGENSIYSLAETGFLRRWGKILRFIREYQDCTEFEVELLRNDADRLG